MPTAPLHVYAFNVGQGDHSLLHLPDGTYAVIDTHYKYPLNPADEPPGLTYLKHKKEQGEDVRLKFISISHYHKDHIMGFGKWLDWIEEKNIPLDHLWLPANSSAFLFEKIVMEYKNNKKKFLRNFIKQNKARSQDLEDYIEDKKTSPFWRLINFIKQIKEQKANGNANGKKICKEKYPAAFYELDIAHECHVDAYCISPLTNRANYFNGLSSLQTLQTILGERKSLSTDANAVSLVLLFRYQGFTLTFGGDSVVDALEESIDELPEFIRKSKGDFSSDFIKIFHHGAEKSTSQKIWESFLKDNGETHIFISSGIHEKYDHPHINSITDINKVAKVLPTEVKYHATNRDHLLKRGDVPLAAVDPKTPFLPPKQPIRDQFDGWPLPQSKQAAACDQPNKTYFMGYRFDFHPEKDTADVVRLEHA